MMKSSRLEEDKNTDENIIKDIRNLFRLKKWKKETNDATVIKSRIIRDIRNLLEYEEEDYYKPVRAGYFCSNNYIEYKSKGDRKTLSVEIS